jgi:integrase/recombinase XerC
MLQTIHGGRSPPLITITCNMIQDYIYYIKVTKGYSENTAKAYAGTLKHFAQANTGKRWSTISEGDIKAYLCARIEKGAKANTIVQDISAIRGFYNWLSRTKGIDNPARYLESPKKTIIAPHVVEPEVIERAIKAEPRRDIKLAIMLMSESGLRVSEARTLKFEDVTQTGAALILGKGKKERYVYLSSRAKDIIFAQGRNDGPIFENWEDRNFRYAIYSAFDRIGARVSPHQLRHTFANTAINKGMRLDVLKDILGHQSLATTQIYLHAAPNVTKAEYYRVMQ